jgi:hypothetical protein
LYVCGWGFKLVFKVGGTDRGEGQGFAEVVDVAMELGYEVSVAGVVVE